jgi:hypothetical protein
MSKIWCAYNAICCMATSDSRKKLWASRIEDGYCVYCGIQPPELNKKGCTSCLKRKYELQKNFLAENSSNQKEYHLKVRQEVIKKYGGRCTCCGESNWAFLVIDHINDDGYQERRDRYGSQRGSSHSFFLLLKRSPIREDLQILCWNCNSAKALYGCCPHNKDWVEPEFSGGDLRRTTTKNFNSNTKIVWPPIAQLVDKVLASNCSAVARELGVHNTALRGHLKRRGCYYALQNVKKERDKK